MPGPLPLEQKRARGRRPGVDSGGRPLPDASGVVALPGADGIPPVPGHLVPNGPGEQRWRAVWAHATWLSPATDGPAMVRLCELEDMRVALREEVGRSGLIVDGYNGQPRPNPLLDLGLKYDDALLRLERQLGLTAAARGQMGVGEVVRPKEQSPLERVIAQHAQRAAGE